MATTLRLQRQGKKRKAIYHVVVADSRSARNGKFIEKLGTFNPNTNPPQISIDFERSLYWAKTGAETSDAVRTILSSEGILMKKHLDGGVTKGALTQEQADAKFATWLDAKKSNNDKTAQAGNSAKIEAKKKALAAEKAASDARAAATTAKLAEAEAAAVAAANPVVEEVAAEAPVAETETPSAEAEAPAAE